MIRAGVWQVVVVEAKERESGLDRQRNAGDNARSIEHLKGKDQAILPSVHAGADLAYHGLGSEKIKSCLTAVDLLAQPPSASTIRMIAFARPPKSAESFIHTPLRSALKVWPRSLAVKLQCVEKWSPSKAGARRTPGPGRTLRALRPLLQSVRSVAQYYRCVAWLGI
jgi:hypothetical protein